MGCVESIFIAEEEDVKKAIGKEVCFGEILGKHSNVHGKLEDGDIVELTDDQDFIEKAVKFYLVPTGRNPLNYFREDEDE